MAAPADPRPAEILALHARLAPILASLAYPARPWQVLTEADLYGTDGTSRALLRRLPERDYASLGELLAVLAAVLGGRSAPTGVAP